MRTRVRAKQIDSSRLLDAIKKVKIIYSQRLSQYHATNPSSSSFDTDLHGFLKLRRLYRSRLEKIRNIQRRYNISGMTYCKVRVGRTLARMNHQYEHLVLIQSDLVRLEHTKKSQIKAWLDYILFNELAMYQLKPETKHTHQCTVEISPAYLRTVADCYDWAEIIFDKERTPIFITFGCGLDLRSPSSWIMFGYYDGECAEDEDDDY